MNSRYKGMDDAARLALNYTSPAGGVRRWRSTGLPLKEFASITAGLSAHVLGLVARGFLLTQARFSAALPTKTLVGVPPVDLPRDLPSSFAVLPLCRRPGSDLPFITIGRLDGNDVALPDPTVSKLHALIVDVGDTLGVFDAQSTNGTVVERRSIKPKRQGGAATPLESGDTILFGAVRTTYLDADAVLGFVRDHV